MSADSNRPRRVAELLKRELAQLIQRELSDPRAADVTVTAVEAARDLKSAKVYFSVPGGSADSRATMAVLNHAAGFLRHCLRGRVDLRIIPALRFVYDPSIERGMRIAKLLDDAGSDKS